MGRLGGLQSLIAGSLLDFEASQFDLLRDLSAGKHLCRAHRLQNYVGFYFSLVLCCSHNVSAVWNPIYNTFLCVCALTLCRKVSFAYMSVSFRLKLAV